jgi:hypothetical protein
VVREAPAPEVAAAGGCLSSFALADGPASERPGVEDSRLLVSGTSCFSRVELAGSLPLCGGVREEEGLSGSFSWTPGADCSGLPLSLKALPDPTLGMPPGGQAAVEK